MKQRNDRKITAQMTRQNYDWIINSRYKITDLINASINLLRAQPDSNLYEHILSAIQDKGRDKLIDSQE